MQIFLVFFFSVLLLLPAPGLAADILALPDSIGSNPVLTRVEDVKTWPPDDMYEHVNGEAELLKRYGALSLSYAAYENTAGTYLSVDLLDMGAAVNAFGLYRLYTGCDGEEYSSSGATVLPGDFTSYAMLGRHFMKIDVETSGDSGEGKSLVGDFLSELVRILPASEPLPRVIDHLKTVAGKLCEVGYHPEHVDYDLQSGPGYTWTGPDGGTYYVRFLRSPDEAATYAAVMRNKGVPTVLVWINAVAWSQAPTEESASYLTKIVKTLVE